MSDRSDSGAATHRIELATRLGVREPVEVVHLSQKRLPQHGN
jgi:hypothetical protein